MTHILATPLLAEGPASWLLHEFISMFWGGELKNLVTGNPDSSTVYGSLYGALTGAGFAIAASAAVIRILKMMADQRATGVQIILDFVVRMGITVGILGLPGQDPSTSVGFQVIAGDHGVIAISMGIGLSMFTTILGAIPHMLTVGGSAGGGLGMIGLYLLTAGEKFITSGTGLLILLLAGVLVLFLVYFGILMIARFLLTSMVIAMAPLAIGISIFEPKNRLTEWWVEAFIGAAMIPIVFGFSFGLTIALATSSVWGPGGALAPIVTPIVLIGGIWLTGKMMHKLTWRHFQHGGPIGALAAGFSGAWVGAQLAFEAHAGLAAAGFRGGKGLMGLGLDPKTGKQGPIGNLMDGALMAFSQKNAAFSMLNQIQEFDREKKGTRAAAQAAADGTPPDAVQMQQILGALSGTSRPAIESTPGGAQAFIDFMNNPSNAVRDPILGMVSHNPNDYVGGYLHSAYNSGPSSPPIPPPSSPPPSSPPPRSSYVPPLQSSPQPVAGWSGQALEGAAQRAEAAGGLDLSHLLPQPPNP